MNDGMRLPFENERSWPVQPLWTVFAPIARLADTSLPVLSVSIHSGISDKELSNEERERNVWLSEDRSKYQKVVPGDLVYNSMRAWQGGFGACQTLGLVSPAYGVLSPISTINTKFYELLFRTKGYIALFDTFSPGIIDFRKRLSWDRCKHMKVPVPPLEEQNRIVKFACNVGAKVHLVTQKLQQQLDLLNEYRQSLITRAVTKGLDPNVEMKDSGVEWIGNIPKNWLIPTLSHVCRSMRNGYVGPTDELFVPDGIKYVQSLHVKNGEIDFSVKEYYVREEWAKTHPKLRKGNLVIVQTGDIGQVGVVRQNLHNSNCHALIICDIKDDICNVDFLSFYFQSKPGKELLLLTKTGLGLPHLNTGKVCYCKVPLPPLEEQKRISIYCSNIERQICKAEKTIRETILKLNEYRSSLTSAAVTGQLAIDEEASA